MKLTPASSAAWMVRIDCSSAGRLESDIGMPPSPIGKTSASPSSRVLVISDAYPLHPHPEHVHGGLDDLGALHLGVVRPPDREPGEPRPHDLRGHLERERL